jgi:hypothetical protein
MHHVGLTINTVGREVGAAAEHRFRLIFIGRVEFTQHDEFVMEDVMGDAPTFIGCGDLFQAGFVDQRVVVIRLRVIQHPELHPTGECRVDRLDDRLQLVLVDGNIQRPLSVHGALDKPQKLSQQTVFQPLARGVGPGFDGQVLVSAEQCVEIGEFARERLTGGHRTIEDDPLALWLTVV